ncbi:hypothetical protein AC629_34305 [Bradyrhizobium sp. NAS80.1]|uniref:hypothetical protein n=1 Tax=Bradyrhizobium sp. NAS80.1 TaxID=1680159 RepID=UPI0009659D9D|nr:hypothetical protein [Bradyrhizobium sp. NAS80.1]OKO75113.1 hypothetical protein AC629_34305 [Bradyrhizobium sp. NAS80.1]
MFILLKLLPHMICLCTPFAEIVFGHLVRPSSSLVAYIAEMPPGGLNASIPIIEQLYACVNGTSFSIADSQGINQANAAAHWDGYNFVVDWVFTGARRKPQFGMKRAALGAARVVSRQSG